MWQEEQDLACPGCGHPRDEAWVWSEDEQHEKEALWEGHMRHCVVCAKRDFTAKNWHDQEHHQLGVYPVVVRREVVDG